MRLPLYPGVYSKKFFTGRLCPEIQLLTLFHSHKMHLVVLLGLFTNQKTDSLPFHLIQQVNSLHFHKTKAWKGTSLPLSGRASPYTPYRPLKEQYPVTAHALNFDFWTGCREIKRCEESKRTLKNPFASRLAEFDTTVNLLRITDQWYYWVSIWAKSGCFGVTFIAVGRRTKRWEAL